MLSDLNDTFIPTNYNAPQKKSAPKKSPPLKPRPSRKKQEEQRKATEGTPELNSQTTSKNNPCYNFADKAQELANEVFNENDLKGSAIKFEEKLSAFYLGGTGLGSSYASAVAFYKGQETQLTSAPFGTTAGSPWRDRPYITTSDPNGALVSCVS